MAPRKSTSRSTRAEQSVASSSKTVKTLQAVSLPDTITPTFKRQKVERRVLDDDERGVLIHEVSQMVSSVTYEDWKADGNS